MRKHAIWSILILFFLTGCDFGKFVAMSKKDWEAERAKIEKQYGDKAEAAIKQIENERKKKEDLKDANDHKVAGLAYGVYQLSELKPTSERTRPETLINYKAKEMVARLPGLTAEELIKANDELRQELDERNTTLNELQKKYDQALEQSRADKAAIVAVQAAIDAKKLELEKINKDAQEARLGLETEHRKVAEVEANKAQQDKQRAESRASIIALLIKIFVGIGIACAVGAYAMRSLILVAAAAGSISLSVFIAFVQPWVIITGGCIIGAIIIGGIGYKLYQTHVAHIDEKNLNDGLVGGIEDFKNSVGVDKFKEELGTHITEWTKDIPKVDDKIKGKLKELNLI